ncbi:putative spermidine/putrescine transport system substrate-binding protein [Rhizobium mesoamericanum]|uniref:ABC transporter substrate-binding protein n=1 Tax=Rhizobium mesoamericanum TaxID=1079800 RepID=UPI0027869593|nr:ABC transporter substrate-binding protein [Rhizobium mesoamericanum]MDQ0562957.1 putative spermidine/putrescine transport system substrate-binding protein [Rhizobium mesoamericanum]
MSIKTTSLGIGAALLFSAMTAAAYADDVAANLKGEGEVVVTSGGGTWEAAQKKAFYEPFTRDTGIKVVLVPEDHAKLLASIKLGQPEADVTEIPGGTINSWIGKDAVEPIDYSLFAKETLAGMPEQMKHKYGVGALIAAAVVAYNTNTYPDGAKHPDNWVDFYDVKKFPGKRSLPKCEKMLDAGLLEGALLGDGVSPDKLYPLDMDRAFKKLKEIEPNVGRWWIAGADAPQSLISGEVDMAAAYNGRIVNARKEGAPLQLSWNQALLSFDYWVIAKDSPNKENAAKLLAYISRPGPQAAFAEAMSYGPVNNDAFKLIPQDVAKSLPGAPEIAKNQIFQNFEWWSTATADGRTNYDVAMERCVALLTQ